MNAIKHSNRTVDYTITRKQFTSKSNCMYANGPVVSIARTLRAIIADIEECTAMKDIHVIIPIVALSIRKEVF